MGTPSSHSSVAGKFWAFTGGIPQHPLSPAYHLGLAGVAAFMVLLPILYLGLVGLFFWLVYAFAVGQLGFGLPAMGGQVSLISLLLYLAPLPFGLVILFFMIKPLFAFRRDPVVPIRLRPDYEPKLFGFIQELCQVLRAPEPHRIEVDMEVNASARFSYGFWGLLTNQLTLTIGLPMAANLSASELSGVLAHELGHFAQGAAMRATYIIRAINRWLLKVVYERDAWDIRLDEWGRKSVVAGLFIVPTQMVLWLIRKLLLGFRVAAYWVSNFMMRQMEFDADALECRVAGSSAFATTSQRLLQISEGWDRVVGGQQAAYRSRRLVDNLPALTRIETARLPYETLLGLEKARADEKATWRDMHPSYSARVAAATRLNAPGILTVEGPAAAFFEDFDALCRKATMAFYRDECGIDLAGIDLKSLDHMASEAGLRNAAAQSFDAFFGPLLSPANLLVLGMVPSVSLEEARQCHREAVAAHLAVPDAMKKRAAELAEAYCKEVLAAQATSLMRAGFRVAPSAFGLPAGLDPTAALQKAISNTQAARAVLTPAMEAARNRLLWALAGAVALRGGEPEVREAEELASMLSAMRFFQASPWLLTLRRDVVALDLLLQSSTETDAMIRAEIERLDQSIATALREIHVHSAQAEFPFEHARGRVKLSEYFASDIIHPQPVVHRLILAQALLEGAFELYHRVLSRLVVVAQGMESHWNQNAS